MLSSGHCAHLMRDLSILLFTIERRLRLSLMELAG